MNEERFRHGLQVLSEDVEPSDDALLRLIGKQRKHEIRRRVASGTAGLAVIVAMAVIAVQIRPGGPDAPPFGSGSPSPQPGAVAAQYIAYAFEGDIYVKTMSGGTRRVTSDGNENVDRLPQIHDGKVVWVKDTGASTTLYAAELGTTGGSGLLRFDDGRVQSFTIHDARGIAVLVAEGEQHRVYTVDAMPDALIAPQDDQVLLEFPPHLGRGISSDDEARVEWSPDGSKLLVVSTFSDEVRQNTMQIVDANDEFVVQRRGTHARWLDDDSLLYRSYSGSGWFVLNTSTGDETAGPALPDGSTRPSISPDGTKMAVHVEGDGLPRLFVAEISTGETLLNAAVDGAVPVWLDADTLLVADVEACGGDCAEGWWVTGTSRTVDVTTGENEPFAIPSTQDLSVVHMSSQDGDA